MMKTPPLHGQSIILFDVFQAFGADGFSAIDIIAEMVAANQANCLCHSILTVVGCLLLSYGFHFLALSFIVTGDFGKA